MDLDSTKTSPYHIDLTDSPLSEDIQVIHDGLRAYNTSMGAPTDWLTLAIFIRDSGGSILGGLAGGTYWGWLYIAQFWLSESIRRQGLGSQLLAQAEHEGLRRGCRHSFLDTTSFQALPFYQKRGYQLYAQLDDFPSGHCRYFLKKDLSPILENRP